MYIYSITLHKLYDYSCFSSYIVRVKASIINYNFSKELVKLINTVHLWLILLVNKMFNGEKKFYFLL